MFRRLFTAFSLLLILTVGALGLLVVARVERQFLKQTENSLHARASLLRETIREAPADADAVLQKRMVKLGQEIHTRITLIAADGQVVADSEEDPARMQNHSDRPEIQAALEEGYGASTRYSNTQHETLMYFALKADHRTVAVVRVALSIEGIERQLAGLRRLVWTTAVGTGLATLLLAFWLARRITLPLRELTVNAERIAAGKYGRKVYASGRDEIGVLAQTFNDMSARLAEQFAQMEEDRQQLRMILSGMVEGVIALDADQRVLFANESAGRLLGFQLPSAVDRRLWEVVRRPALQELVRRALAQPEPCQEELNWNGPVARSVTVHAACLPGKPTRGAVLVLHDTSELRRLERLRQEFAANVSHELKTPLSVIKSAVETLLDGAIEDTAHRGAFLQKIADQAERLHALILDLISLARIEAGTEVFEFQSVAVAPVVQACLERYQERAQARRQTVCAGPSAEAAAVWADEEALSQILDNLIDNALKYTPDDGRIEVRWQEQGTNIYLEVKDTGIGIPESDLPRVFERFYRVDKARSRELGGTGLGLAIVKHLVQTMRGTVQVTSRVGQGSTFTVCLPRAAVA
jgi:two-component system, OmpR family, phosphate regulon sensor histidine kinase PhoR